MNYFKLGLVGVSSLALAACAQGNAAEFNEAYDSKWTPVPTVTPNVCDDYAWWMFWLAEECSVPTTPPPFVPPVGCEGNECLPPPPPPVVDPECTVECDDPPVVDPECTVDCGNDPEDPNEPQTCNNPGNGKPVGNSPHDGITGNSGNNDQNRGSPSAGPMDGERDDTATNQPSGGGANGGGSNANGNQGGNGNGNNGRNGN